MLQEEEDTLHEELQTFMEMPLKDGKQSIELDEWIHSKTVNPSSTDMSDFLSDFYIY